MRNDFRWVAKAMLILLMAGAASVITHRTTALMGLSAYDQGWFSCAIGSGIAFYLIDKLNL